MEVQVLALLVLRAALGGGEPVPEIDPGRLRGAVERGLRVVEKAARSYPKHRECFSCHHQTLPMQAMAAVRDRGLPADGVLLRDQAAFSLRSFRSRIERLR